MRKQQTTEVEPEAVSKELTLLRGFRDLVGERWGYFLGRRMKQSEMNDATKEERKKANAIRKEISENLETFIKEAQIDVYLGKVADLKNAREVVTKKTKPFREKINPLSKAQRYLDTVAIPDALKELDAPVQPRFSLSKWLTDAMKAEK